MTDLLLIIFWFINSFENNVGKYTDDNGERLQLLIQYCVGKPREVIKSCTLVNPDEGYHKAKALPKERFGDKYVVTVQMHGSEKFRLVQLFKQMMLRPCKIWLMISKTVK